MNETESKSSDKIGPLIGSVIIILIIVLGAFYLFAQIKEKVNQQKMIQEEEIKKSEVSESDDIHQIEVELNSTEIEDVEEDLKSIEVEFQM